MDLNATLIGQMITFAVFVLFTMKYVWPPLTKAMEAREKKIADGLAASQKGELDLELAQKKAVELLKEAKHNANDIVAQARVRADHVIEEAKQAAVHQVDVLTKQAQADIARQFSEAERQLKSQVSLLAMNIAEKIVQRELDKNGHAAFIDQAIEDL